MNGQRRCKSRTMGWVYSMAPTSDHTLHALRALRYRITELDGQLAVFEGERGGLIVRVTLPLEP
ncbi:MAG: hypothetical protein KatS3mg056_1300 [Chloroflexus sp.]|nr:MAG: hypothetical protein KatS3mg056_1300 [Chloroflexus sp.]